MTVAIISGIVTAGSQLYFHACDLPEYDDCELWQSDGTAAGTKRRSDIAPGRQSGVTGDTYFNFNLYPSGGALFFSANDGVTGEELWAFVPGP